MSSWRPSTTSRPLTLTLLVKINLEAGVGFFFENDSAFGRNIVTVTSREQVQRRQVGQTLVDLVEDGGQVLLGELHRALVLADLAHDVERDGAVATLLVGARHVSATRFLFPVRTITLISPWFVQSAAQVFYANITVHNTAPGPAPPRPWHHAWYTFDLMNIADLIHNMG